MVDPDLLLRRHEQKRLLGVETHALHLSLSGKHLFFLRVFEIVFDSVCVGKGSRRSSRQGRVDREAYKSGGISMQVSKFNDAAITL